MLSDTLKREKWKYHVCQPQITGALVGIGLALRAPREPDIDPATLKAAIDHFVADLFAA